MKASNSTAHKKYILHNLLTFPLSFVKHARHWESSNKKGRWCSGLFCYTYKSLLRRKAVKKTVLWCKAFILKDPVNLKARTGFNPHTGICLAVLGWSARHGKPTTASSYRQNLPARLKKKMNRDHTDDHFAPRTIHYSSNNSLTLGL